MKQELKTKMKQLKKEMVQQLKVKEKKSNQWSSERKGRVKLSYNIKKGHLEATKRCKNPAKNTLGR